MIEMLEYPFVQRAIIAGILVGFLGSWYGVFIVQRKMSFLGTGLAHAAFGGVALGLLLEAEPLYVAVPFTVIVSLAITRLKEKTKLESDTSIGILFAVSVALGIIFISLKQNYTADAFTYLFGSILAVMPVDLYLTALVTLLTIAFSFKYWGRWAYASFDRDLSQTDMKTIRADDYILSTLIALTIVVSVKLVGIVLIAAFIVIPAASARLVTNRFIRMTVMAVVFGITSAIAGLWLSFELDLPGGAVIVLLQAVIFIIAAIVGKPSELE